MKDGTKQSKSVADRLAGTHIVCTQTHSLYSGYGNVPCTEELRPCGSASRPKTTALVARRLVARTLGVQLSQEQREREKVQRIELQMARGKSERSEGWRGDMLDYKQCFLYSTKESRSSSVTFSGPDFPSSLTDLYLLHHATTVSLTMHNCIKMIIFLYTHQQQLIKLCVCMAMSMYYTQLCTKQCSSIKKY